MPVMDDHMWVTTYRANIRSKACSHGFSQEQTIKAIWAENEAKRQ